jgi:RNA polymerase sigma factor (sigma-70 family)
MQKTWSTRHTLLQRLMTDDQQAWEDFVVHYRPFTCSILKKMNVSYSDQDELIQLILIKLHENLASYSKEKGRFHSWLATVIKNTIRNYISKDSRLNEKNSELQNNLLTFNENSNSELDELIQDEWMKYLYEKAITRLKGILSENVFSCFEMSLAGEPAEKIADELGVKLESVYTIRTRMKSRLQTEIKKLIAELEF